MKRSLEDSLNDPEFAKIVVFTCEDLPINGPSSYGISVKVFLKNGAQESFRSPDFFSTENAALQEKNRMLQSTGRQNIFGDTSKWFPEDIKQSISE